MTSFSRLPSRCRAALRALMVVGMTLASTALQARDLYVVVHASNAATQLSQRDVLSLYTGRTRAFPDGSSAVPIDQGRTSAARESFYQAVAGMDLARINSYWARLQFSGQVQSPLTADGDAQVAAFVRGHTGAIGYMTTPPTDPQLRVVLTIKGGSTTE